MSRRAKVAQFPALRQWKAGKVDIMRSGWETYTRPINFDIRSSLAPLRARARSEAQNNDHARAFLRECKSNVVGRGVQLQSKARLASGRPDKAAQAIVEAHWAKWREPGECDVTERLAFADVERQLIETAARDGEFLVRLVPRFPNRYGFAVQSLDPDVVDLRYNVDRGPSGRPVSMGVERDEWGRHTAYYMRPPSANPYIYAKERERVPAEEVILGFLPEWSDQVRGVPWMASGLRRMHDLESYDESAVVAARAGASKMGFYAMGEDAAPMLSETGEDESGLAEATGVNGQLFQDFDPGSIGILPPGVEFQGWDPRYPHSEHGTFIKAVLRGIASGMGVNYNTLASDYEGVNYTSLRAAALSDRDLWIMLQEWLIGCFHKKVFAAWLDAALNTQALVGPRGRVLQLNRYEDLLPAEWQARRWAWVDPQKDASAANAEIDMRTRSRSSVIRERGQEPEKVWQEIADENARLEELGISPEQATAAMSEVEANAGNEE